MTDYKAIKEMGIYQVEYGRALHLLLRSREQIPWRFMERLWNLSFQLATEAALVDEEAATRIPDLDWYRKYHNEAIWGEDQSIRESLGQMGFKRIAITDGDGRTVGYMAESMEGLREQIKAWESERMGLQDGVDQRNVRIRLRQLGRILDELRTDVLDPDRRLNYLNFTGGSIEEDEEDQPSKLFVDPVCLADAALHAKFKPHRATKSRQLKSHQYLAQIANDQLIQIYHPRFLGLPEDSPGIALLENTLTAVDFYVTPLPQRAWSTLTSKKPESTLSLFPHLRSLNTRRTDQQTKTAAYAVTRCLEGLESLNEIGSTGFNSLKSRLLHIKARLILGGYWPKDNSWFDPDYNDQYELARALITNAKQEITRDDNSSIPGHLLRLEIDLLLAELMDSNFQKYADTALRGVGFAAEVNVKDGGDLKSRFQVLISDAEKLGDTELLHAVELNKIQFMHSGDERRGMIEVLLKKEVDISDWTRTLCDYLLAHNADSKQRIGFRISALYKMHKMDALRSRKLWESLTIVGSDRPDRHPLHARELILEIWKDWSVDPATSYSRELHSFIGSLSNDYLNFISGWLPKIGKESSFSLVLESGSQFEAIVECFDDARNDLERMVETPPAEFFPEPTDIPEKSKLMVLNRRRFERRKPVSKYGHMYPRWNNARKQMCRMAGIALLFGSDRELKLKVQCFSDILEFDENKQMFDLADSTPHPKRTMEMFDLVLANLLGGHKTFFRAEPGEDLEDLIFKKKHLHSFPRILKYLVAPRTVLRENITLSTDRLSKIPLEIKQDHPIQIQDAEGAKVEIPVIRKPRQLKLYRNSLASLRETAQWIATDVVPSRIIDPDAVLELMSDLMEMQQQHSKIIEIYEDTRIDYEIREVAEALLSLVPETRSEHYKFAVALDWMDKLTAELLQHSSNTPKDWPGNTPRFPHLAEVDPFETNFLRLIDLKSRIKRHLIMHKGEGYAMMHKKDLEKLLNDRGLDTSGKKTMLISRLIENDGEVLGPLEPSITKTKRYSKMLKKDLEKLLFDRGLDTSGKKAELINRAMASDPASTISADRIEDIDTQVIHPRILHSRKTGLNWILSHLIQEVDPDSTLLDFDEPLEENPPYADSPIPVHWTQRYLSQMLVAFYIQEKGKGKVKVNVLDKDTGKVTVKVLDMDKSSRKVKVNVLDKDKDKDKIGDTGAAS